MCFVNLMIKSSNKRECVGASLKVSAEGKPCSAHERWEKAASFSTREKASLATEPEAGGQCCTGKNSTNKPLLEIAMV